METIGERIRLLRVKNNFNLKELGLKIGFSDTALSNIENGKTKNISIEAGKELAKALNVSFNELFEISVSADSDLNHYKTENERLRKENETLKTDLDNYRTLIDVLKKHQITGWPNFIKPDGSFEEIDLSDFGAVLDELKQDEHRRKEALKEIRNNPDVLRLVKAISPFSWLKEELGKDY